MKFKINDIVEFIPNEPKKPRHINRCGIHKRHGNKFVITRIGITYLSLRSIETKDGFIVSKTYMRHIITQKQLNLFEDNNES